MAWASSAARRTPSPPTVSLRAFWVVGVLGGGEEGRRCQILEGRGCPEERRGGIWQERRRCAAAELYRWPCAWVAGGGASAAGSQSEEVWGDVRIQQNEEVDWHDEAMLALGIDSAL